MCELDVNGLVARDFVLRVLHRIGALLPNVVVVSAPQRPYQFEGEFAVFALVRVIQLVEDAVVWPVRIKWKS